MRVILKSQREIDAIRRSGRLAREVLEHLGSMVRPGITTQELDEEAYRRITAAGAVPAPLNYNGFPKSICTSINEVVCHGIPERRALREGDIINIDVTTNLEGFHGDCSKTFLVGDVTPAAAALVDVTRECLDAAIRIVAPGVPLGEIGNVIHDIADRHGYGVVDEFCGHGIGRNFHEPPSIYHFRNDRSKKRMKAGMVFTIEPMINEGVPGTRVLGDGWTAITLDEKLSAQFEHTVAVTEDGFDVLTALDGEFAPRA